MRSTPIRWLVTFIVAWLAIPGIDPGVSAQQPQQGQPRKGMIRIAKLRHAGDWDVAPLAIPNLQKSLREKLKFNVVINHKDIFPRDPNLVHYPLIIMNGRAAFDFDEVEKAALLRHINSGGGTLFADATAASPEFDAAFRRFIASLLPNNPLVAISRGDDLYNMKRGYNLADARRTAAAGGKADFPDLEGIWIDGHWAVIYSRLDVVSALEQPADIAEKGYTHDGALKIVTNVVLDATRP